MRRRTKRAYRVLLWLLLAMLLAAAGVAGLHLWQRARDKARADRLLWEMRQTALSAQTDPVQTDMMPGPASGPGDGPLPDTQPDAGADTAAGGENTPSQPPSPGQAPDGETGRPSDAPPDPMSGAGEDVLHDTPPVPTPGNGAGQELPAHACPVDFAALRARYPDVTAWLTGCGGAIDTPIVQGADNMYYLDHLPDGTNNRLGAAFLDSENRPSFTDDQSFLFGHHMDTGGGVFSPLLYYQDAGYWREAPDFTLHTPDGCYSAEVFAAFVIQEREYPYQRECASAGEMRTFLGEVCARSQIETSVHPAPGDRILTLCTCTSKTNDLRYVVCTRLVPLADAEG